uniref:MARVEL domain-containing protein n=1 Tax=Steinernema glaseri TaxID=37863 RepID=A0A1I7Z7R0_9BILA
MEQDSVETANLAPNPHLLSPTDVKKDCVYRAASLICLILLIVEIVGGSAAGSILLITDGVRLFADYLTHYSTNKNLSPCWRYSEFGLLIACVLFLYALTGVFVFCATQRAMSTEFEIDETLLLIISIIAVLCNIAMLVMHFSKVILI